MKNENANNSSKRIRMNGINGIFKLKPESKVACNKGSSGIPKLNSKNIQTNAINAKVNDNSKNK